MDTTTLRQLANQTPNLLVADWDSSGQRNSYGYLEDLIEQLDQRNYYTADGEKLPGQADTEFCIRQHKEGHYSLMSTDFGTTEPRYLIMSEDAYTLEFDTPPTTTDGQKLTLYKVTDSASEDPLWVYATDITDALNTVLEHYGEETIDTGLVSCKWTNAAGVEYQVQEYGIGTDDYPEWQDPIVATWHDLEEA